MGSKGLEPSPLSKKHYFISTTSQSAVWTSMTQLLRDTTTDTPNRHVLQRRPNSIKWFPLESLRADPDSSVGRRNDVAALVP